jgi:hypothetical protein
MDLIGICLLLQCRDGGGVLHNTSVVLYHFHHRVCARDARSRVMHAEHQNTFTQRRCYGNAHNDFSREIS